jgi:hypothetical protein
VVGGIIVGMTSVGSGSLMIVLLLFVYATLVSLRPWRTADLPLADDR